MFHIRRALAGAAALALVPAVVDAAPIVSLKPRYVTSYNQNFEDVGQMDLRLPTSAAFIHEIQFTVDLGTSLESTENFGFVLFDVNLGSGLSAVDLGGGQRYLATSATFDPPGPVGATPYYSTNNDGGSSASDLKGITVIAAHNTAASQQPGEAGRSTSDGIGYPSLMGSVFVQWNGISNSSVTTAPSPGTFFSVSQSNTYVGRSDSTFDGGGVEFGIVPEPASVVMLGLGALSLLGRRRRTA